MKNENKYKDLYMLGISALITLMVAPLIIKWWSITLYQPINSEMVEQVQEFYEEEEKEISKEILRQNDINEMNKNTVLIAVKSLELEHENNPYYFLRNNDGSLYIVEDDRMRHEENYILEVDKVTDEIIEIHWDLKFEFNEADESIFTEWYHHDIETGREMLNEYLGIKEYTEISI